MSLRDYVVEVDLAIYALGRYNLVSSIKCVYGLATYLVCVYPSVSAKVEEPVPVLSASPYRFSRRQLGLPRVVDVIGALNPAWLRG